MQNRNSDNLVSSGGKAAASDVTGPNYLPPDLIPQAKTIAVRYSGVSENGSGIAQILSFQGRHTGGNPKSSEKALLDISCSRFGTTEGFRRDVAELNKLIWL